MEDVNITELRENLAHYLERVKRGGAIRVTVHGKGVARLVADSEDRTAAKQRLVGLRAKAKIHDIVSPIGDDWDSER